MDQLKARQILGVSADSTEEEIRDAYRELTSHIHPEEDPAGFAAIQQAYRTLTRKHVSSVPLDSYASDDDIFPQSQEIFHPETDREAEEQEEFFRLISEEADSQAAADRRQYFELEDLRNIIRYKGRLPSPERLLYLLQQYPLSYAQYTQLQNMIVTQSTPQFRKDSRYKELLKELRIRRGITPLSRKALIVLCTVITVSSLLLVWLDGTAGGIAAVLMLVSLLGYYGLRIIALPPVALMLFGLMLFFDGVMTILLATEVCENAGFIMILISAVLFVWSVISLVIWAVRATLDGKHSTLR